MVIVGFCQPLVPRSAPVHNKKVFDVVALVPLVQHAILRVVAHTAGAELVNAVAGWIGHWIRSQNLNAACLGKREACLHRVARHIELVIGVLGMDMQCGNSPGIDGGLVDAHVVLIASQHLSICVGRKSAATVALGLLLQFGSVGS